MKTPSATRASLSMDTTMRLLMRLCCPVDSFASPVLGKNTLRLCDVYSGVSVRLNKGHTKDVNNVALSSQKLEAHMMNRWTNGDDDNELSASVTAAYQRHSSHTVDDLTDSLNKAQAEPGDTPNTTGIL